MAEWKFDQQRFVLPYFWAGGPRRRSSHSPGLALVILAAIAALWWLGS